MYFLIPRYVTCNSILLIWDGSGSISLVIEPVCGAKLVLWCWNSDLSIEQGILEFTAVYIQLVSNV